MAGYAHAMSTVACASVRLRMWSALYRKPSSRCPRREYARHEKGKVQFWTPGQIGGSRECGRKRESPGARVGARKSFDHSGRAGIDSRQQWRTSVQTGLISRVSEGATPSPASSFKSSIGVLGSSDPTEFGTQYKNTAGASPVTPTNQWPFRISRGSRVHDREAGEVKSFAGPPLSRIRVVSSSDASVALGREPHCWRWWGRIPPFREGVAQCVRAPRGDRAI